MKLAGFEVKSYLDFWRFCRKLCPNFKTGCANQCKLREQLGIPPFGKTYKCKETGAIKEPVAEEL